MTWRARVTSSSLARDGIYVAVGEVGERSALVVTGLSTDSPQFETFEAPVEVPPLFIPDGVARALLDALAAHYGGTGDTRMLRSDYDRERARVDKLTDTLIELVTRG